MISIRVSESVKPGARSTVAFAVDDDEAGEIGVIKFEVADPARPDELEADVGGNPKLFAEWAAHHALQLLAFRELPSEQSEQVVPVVDDLLGGFKRFQRSAKTCEALSKHRRQSNCAIGTRQLNGRSKMFTTTASEYPSGCGLSDERWLRISLVGIRRARANAQNLCPARA